MTSRRHIPWYGRLIRAICTIIVYPFIGIYARYENFTEQPIRPLHRTKKRTLTLPLPEESYRGLRPKRTYDQAQCLFLQILPYDIRRQIYEYVLAAPEPLHILNTRKRLRSVRCFDSSGTPSYKHFNTCTSGYKYREDNRKPIYLDLLYCCRQIYSESIHVFYTENILDVKEDVGDFRV